MIESGQLVVLLDMDSYVVSSDGVRGNNYQPSVVPPLSRDSSDVTFPVRYLLDVPGPVRSRRRLADQVVRQSRARDGRCGNRHAPEHMTSGVQSTEGTMRRSALPDEQAYRCRQRCQVGGE